MLLLPPNSVGTTSVITRISRGASARYFAMQYCGTVIGIEQEASNASFGTNRSSTCAGESLGLYRITSVAQLLAYAPRVWPTPGSTSFCCNDARTTPHSCTTSLPPPAAGGGETKI